MGPITDTTAKGSWPGGKVADVGEGLDFVPQPDIIKNKKTTAKTSKTAVLFSM
jgi:hypothetical protein